MNYFTQDLIIRGQSNDDKVLNEVEAQWDANCERYVAYLDSVRDRLPPGLRRRLDNYYLHDAVIRGMGRQRNSFVIIVQLDNHHGDLSYLNGTEFHRTCDCRSDANCNPTANLEFTSGFSARNPGYPSAEQPNLNRSTRALGHRTRRSDHEAQ